MDEVGRMLTPAEKFLVPRYVGVGLTLDREALRHPSGSRLGEFATQCGVG